METKMINDSHIENSFLLEKEKFKQNGDFIYQQWKPVAIDGWNTHILDVGKGEIIIFVPICQNMEVFDSLLIQHFSKNYRVITYQRRESEDEILDMAERSGDIKKVLDYLGIAKAHFVSHSSGSVATTNLAFKYPEFFLSYVWMNLSPKPAMHMSVGRKVLAELVKYIPLSDEIVSSAIAKVTAVDNDQTLLYQRIKEQFLAIKKSANVKNVRKWFANSVWTLSRYDWTDTLGGLKMPIQLINSDNDRVNSIAAMGMIQHQLSNCYGYKIVRGGGHFFHYPKAEQVIGYMEEFYWRLRGQA